MVKRRHTTGFHAPGPCAALAFAALALLPDRGRLGGDSCEMAWNAWNMILGGARGDLAGSLQLRIDFIVAKF